MVGTIDVNSDSAVWTSDSYEGMLRSSSDAECWAECFLFMSGLRSLVPPNHTQSILLTPKGGSRLPRVQVV